VLVAPKAVYATLPPAGCGGEQPFGDIQALRFTGLPAGGVGYADEH
jgi:hypothetical protein